MYRTTCNFLDMRSRVLASNAGYADEIAVDFELFVDSSCD